MVDKYVSDGKVMYVLMIPDQKGRTADYTLNLGLLALKANIYTLKAGANAVVKTQVSTTLGKATIKVSETPVFVEAAN